VEFIQQLFFSPLFVYYLSFMSLQHLTTASWSLYVVLFPILIIAGSFILGFKLKLGSKSVFLLPIIIFLILQLIPLPRTPFKGFDGSNLSRNEPYAIGVGYPYSIVKVFLGDGCLVSNEKLCVNELGDAQQYLKIVGNTSSPIIHKGDIVLLPEGMITRFAGIWIGLLFYTYLLLFFFFFIVSKIKSRKSKNIVDESPLVHTETIS